MNDGNELFRNNMPNTLDVGAHASPELNEQIDWQSLAITDDLTGIANRRGIKMWAEDCYKKDRTYAMVVMDVADFGKLNNDHTQEVGDRALSVLGTVLESSLRTNDEETDNRRTVEASDSLPARLGGDEFVCFIDLDHLSTEEVIKVMVQIENRIATNYQKACGDLPVQPRLRIGSVISNKNEPFIEFFARGNREISEVKKQQKITEARALLEYYASLSNVSFT